MTATTAPDDTAGPVSPAIAASARGMGRALSVVVLGSFAGFTAIGVSASSMPPTTYGAVSAFAGAVGLSAGVSLLIAGAVSSCSRSGLLIPVLVNAAGVCWLADIWVGWSDGSAAARSVAMVASPFLVPVLAHVALASPASRPLGRATSFVLGSLYAATAIVSVGYALTREPLFSADCWSNCSDNVFLVRRDADVVLALRHIWPWIVSAAAVIAIAGATARLARATRVARRAIWAAPTAAAAATTAAAVHAWLVFEGHETPRSQMFRTLYVVRAATLIALAGGVLWGLWLKRRTVRSLGRLVDDLGAMPAPGALELVLARSLGDDRLNVSYWLPSSKCYVDTSGRAASPHPAVGQTTTAIVRNGEPVALVVHDAAVDPRDAFGPAARLAIDNERLRAEVLAHLHDLRASRARIVAAADSTRSRLERDLHDGAQQRLLAASFELRQARAVAERSGDESLVGALNEASDEAGRALTEVRDLAHGIFPAILTESGLEPAVRSLAATAPIAVEVGEMADGRYPTSVENAAYAVIAASTGDVAPSASAVLVRVADQGGVLAISVQTEGAELSRGVLVDLGDRVGALGGTVTTVGDTMRVEIPCAS